LQSVLVWCLDFVPSHHCASLVFRKTFWQKGNTFCLSYQNHDWCCDSDWVHECHVCCEVSV
jgi:hypothetical protein